MPSAAPGPAVCPAVVCVVLNWNGWRDTVPCVEALLAQEYPALTVIIVDNASTDDSVQRIRAALPGVELLEAAGNFGFAAGCNLGIHEALARRAEFVWLLNNDTLAPPDTLTRLVAATTADASTARIGIVGTVLRYFDDPANVQAWGGGKVARLTGYSTHFYAPAPLGTNSFLTFASVLLRCDLLRSIGMLDDGYFMYFEDADFCFRARDAGWQMAVASDTAVLHREGGSAVARTARQDRIVTASGMRFLRRHGRPRWLAPGAFLLSRLAKRALTLRFGSFRTVLDGFADWRRTLPSEFQEEA